MTQVTNRSHFGSRQRAARLAVDLSLRET